MPIQDRDWYRAEPIRMTRSQAMVHRERQAALQRQGAPQAPQCGGRRVLIASWALALVAVLVWVLIPLVWLLMV